MKAQDPSLQTLRELIGPESVAKLQAEFGGSQIYIPPGNKLPARYSPALRLSGAFGGAVRPEIAVQAVARAADVLRQGGVIGLGVEVEQVGLGQGYADRLEDALAGTDIKVLARLQFR